MSIIAFGEKPLLPAPLKATVLLTRPQADAQRFANMLRDIPVNMLISTVLRIVSVAYDAKKLADAPGLVFTSAHAVSAAGLGRGRLALCVGPRTAELARAAGFDVTQGPGDAAGLVPLIRAAGIPLLHPRGRHVAKHLPVAGIEVYDQQMQALSAEAIALFGEKNPVIIPLFSPRSAGFVSQQLDIQREAPVWLAPVSPAALSGWQAGYERAVVADSPNANGVRAAIMTLLSGEQ